MRSDRLGSHDRRSLPNGTHRSLVGKWHGVPDEDLAPVLTEFFQD